jgi:surface antigen
MLKRIAWILASIFALVIVAPDRSAFGSGFAFAAAGAQASKSKAKTKAQAKTQAKAKNQAKAKAKSKDHVTQDNSDALSAFMSSPTFTRVTDSVPSAVEAGPLFPLRGGLVCQRMTQMVKIDGQNVHASALMCRHPNGVWKIAVPPDMRDAATARGSASAGPPKPDPKKGSVPRPSPTGSPVAKAG